MGNNESVANGSMVLVRREESFGSKSPARSHRINNVARFPFGANSKSSERIALNDRLQRRLLSKAGGVLPTNRSQSLEQGGHSPSSSRSSSSNSYVNSILSGCAPGTSGERNCLRQSAQPKFQICGDLTPHQIQLIRRGWKKAMKAIDEDTTELAACLLLRIFQLDARNQEHFFLSNVPYDERELRANALFIQHVKTMEPVLTHVMTHLANATSLSKHLQQLGGRHVQFTTVTYKSSYWRSFMQALIDVLGADCGNADVYDAFTVLGGFCMEQMRIGYKIEYKLQREAEKFAQTQLKRREQLELARSGGGDGGSEGRK